MSSSEPDDQGVSVASTPLHLSNSHSFNVDKSGPGRPTPIFLPEPKSFSTKKQRGSLLFRPPPPRPQAKTCPPISRVFKRRPELHTTQSVTFIHAGDESSVQGTPLLPSAVYDSAKKASYFEQAFAIEAKIGAGCFGNVYRVRSKEDGQLYAVKIARDCYRSQSDRAKKLEEVRKHQLLLPHSNCVHFYQSWEEKGRLHQQFELCERSLMELSEQEHDIAERTIWNYLVDLLLAVEHLHDHGLIHMDIKPENIFIGREGVCKLGDFGLVIDLAQDDTTHAVEGDPRYLAPEILDSRMFGKPADIFSLGVTILELSCDLDLPKHGVLWHKLRSDGPDPSLTSHLSADLKRIIQLMMTNYIDRRPTVKQLLSLPAVQRARKSRERQLTITGLVGHLQTWTSPFCAVVTFVFTLLFWIPFAAVRSAARHLFASAIRTPVSHGDLKLRPEFYLMTEEDVADHSSHFAPDRSSSVLASPLGLNFSDEDDETNFLEGVDGKKVALSPNDFEITPKLSRIASGGSSRYKARLTNASPSFTSPKKRLNFDSFVSDSPRAAEKNSASPVLVQRSTSKKLGTPLSKANGPERDSSFTTPKSRSRRTKVHFFQTNGESLKQPQNNDESDGEANEIQPLSLMAKFDAFSDTDNDDS